MQIFSQIFGLHYVSNQLTKSAEFFGICSQLCRVLYERMHYAAQVSNVKVIRNAYA
jgi:hypothetical protein